MTFDAEKIAREYVTAAQAACDPNCHGRCVRCPTQEIHEQVVAALTLVQAVEWRDIETAPRDGTNILGRSTGTYHGIPFVVRWVPSDIFPEYPWVCAIGGGRFADGSVTHWMPLPFPPVPKAET